MSSKDSARRGFAARLKEHPWIAAALAVAAIVSSFGGAVLTVDGVRQTAAGWFSPGVLVAADDRIRGVEDRAVEIDLLGNDRGLTSRSDPVVRLRSAPSHGRVELAGVGVALYTPDPDFNGDDVFGYEVQRGEEISAATVRVVVEPVNDPPSAAALEIRTGYADQVGAVVDLAAGASDPEGDEVFVDTFHVAGTSEQPERLLSKIRVFANRTGVPIPGDRAAALARQIVLPVDAWVEEARDDTTRVIRKTLEYRLRDGEGATTEASAPIVVMVERIRQIVLQCEHRNGRHPEMMAVELLHQGERIGRKRFYIGSTIAFDFHPLAVPLPAAAADGLEVRASWDEAGLYFNYECDVAVELSTGLSPIAGGVSINGRTDITADTTQISVISLVRMDSAVVDALRMVTEPQQGSG